MDLSAFCQRPMVHSADCMRRTLRVRCTCCQHEAKGLRAAWSASSTAAVRLFGGVECECDIPSTCLFVLGCRFFDSDVHRVLDCKLSAAGFVVILLGTFSFGCVALAQMATGTWQSARCTPSNP